MPDPNARNRSVDALVGTTLSGRYRVQAVLGTGGMGAVVRAHDTRLKRSVAIKVMLPDLGPTGDFSERFVREAELAARLEHPNIVNLHDFGTTPEGMQYLVMQLLEGRELGALLSGPLPPRRAVSIITQVFRALEHAHEHGVIHRDLKPQNVFITNQAKGGESIRILDFGLAKPTEPELDAKKRPKNLTQTGIIMGTPTYMSPEQAVGAPVDHRTDLYSAGVLLYQMLAGCPPFQDDDPIAVIRRHVTATPPELPTHVPIGLRELVGKLMAKVPGERFESATATIAALEDPALWDDERPSRAPALELTSGPTQAPRPEGAHRPMQAIASASGARRATRARAPGARRRKLPLRGVRTPLVLSGMLCVLLVAWLFAPGATATERLDLLTDRIAEFADRVLSGSVTRRSTVPPSTTP